MSEKTGKDPGKFISFEGGEGTGKSTQVNLLKSRLMQSGIDVISTREPGGTPGAEQIRSMLLGGLREKWTPITEILLFYACRTDHLQNKILPALAEGKWVLCDRFADSTFAYQGAGHGLDRRIIEQIHHMTTNNMWPNLTILLDMDPAKGLERAQNRQCENPKPAFKDRFETMPLDFHRRLRQEFLSIAKKNPSRCRIVPAEGSIEETANLIWDQVSTLLHRGSS